MAKYLAIFFAFLWAVATLIAATPAMGAEQTDVEFRGLTFEYKQHYNMEDYGAPEHEWVVFSYAEDEWVCYSGWVEADAASISDGRLLLSNARTGLQEIFGEPALHYQVAFAVNPNDGSESFYSEWWAMTPDRGVCIVQFAVDSRFNPAVLDYIPPEGEPL